MASILNSAEVLADNIFHRIDDLLNERSTLRSEFSRKSIGSIDQEKAFVHACQNGIIDSALSASRASKLEHMLMVR